MPLILIDTGDAEWRERAKAILDEASDERWGATETLNTILATGTPLDETAVDRAASVINPHPNWRNGYDGRQKDRARKKARAAIEAAAKINSPHYE